MILLSSLQEEKEEVKVLFGQTSIAIVVLDFCVWGYLRNHFTSVYFMSIHACDICLQKRREGGQVCVYPSVLDAV